MDASPDLITAADRNFIGSYLKLVDHCPGAAAQTFGSVVAFATGAPIGIFNGCIVTEPATADEIASALAWIAARDVPYEFWIREDLADEVRPIAIEQGLRESPWHMPQMVLDPARAVQSAAPGVTVKAASDRPMLDVFHRIFVDGGMAAHVAARLFPRSLAGDPDVRFLVAYQDDRPVGTSLAIRTGDVAGVYAVGTLPDARRRGVGTAATWAAVAAGRAWGCDPIVLQSSEMGLPVYRAMGFRTVTTYTVYGS